MIPFNKPFLTGNELEYIGKALSLGKTSGDGLFTKKCHDFFEKRFGFKKVLLTTSCTDALEMAAILIDIKPGDEVIVPSYTFVSTANAFALRGAEIVFADSYANNPNIDPAGIESLITSKTKAIVVVHYAGVACDMDKITAIAQKHGLYVVEDAAQAIDSYYNDRPLGSIGHLAAFSFHETKNVIAGEGGMLVINDERFTGRAEIIWEKGTNRGSFFRGEVNKYEWVDIGSSFLPSDIIAAFLYAQLESLETIQTRRKALWGRYYEELKCLSDKNLLGLPALPAYATGNGHMFYVVTTDAAARTALLNKLRASGINAAFHHPSLHKSSFYAYKHDVPEFPNADHYTDCLLRLPLYYDLTAADQDIVINEIIDFYKQA